MENNISNEYSNNINTAYFCNKILKCDFNHNRVEFKLYFHWDYPGTEFGTLYHGICNRKRVNDYEKMSDEFVKKYIKKSLKKIFENFKPIEYNYD